jgi:MFS family permease
VTGKEGEQTKARGEALPDDMANAFTGFSSSIATAMAIAGGVVIPVGLVLCGILGGWRGLASAFIGFAVAGAHAIAVVWVLSWALKKPPRWLPSILMMSYIARLAALFGILYGLYMAKALNMIAVLLCFLALYIAQTAVEIFFAWRAFGAVLKSTGK